MASFFCKLTAILSQMAIKESLWKLARILILYCTYDLLDFQYYIRNLHKTVQNRNRHRFYRSNTAKEPVDTPTKQKRKICLWYARLWWYCWGGGGSIVRDQLGGGVLEVRAVGAAGGGQHHVGVARELRHLAAAGLRFPGTRGVLR